MIAPAWPIRLPGGAVWPAMNAASGFVNSPEALQRGRLFLGVAADLAHHQDGVGVRVVLEHAEDVDEARAVDRVAADADARALADAEVRELPDRFIRQGSRPADDADPSRLVDISRHDADLALPGRDDARAVRADQPDLGMMRLQIRDRRAMSRTGMPSVIATMSVIPASAASRIASAAAWRRHEDHRRVRAGGLDGLRAGVKNRHAEHVFAATSRRHAPTSLVPYAGTARSGTCPPCR